MTELKAPSRWWYAVAAAIFVLGFVPLVVLGTNAVSGLLDYDVHEFDGASTAEVEVDGGQVAIFTTHNGAGTVRCMGSGAGVPIPDDAPDATALAEPLDHPSVAFSFSKGSETWHRVAVTPDDWEDGTYSISCNLVSASDPRTELGYADNPSILGTFIGLLIAVGIAGLATIAAIVIAIVVGVKRGRASRPPQQPPWPQFPTAPPPPGPPPR